MYFNEVSIGQTTVLSNYISGSLKGQVTHASSPIWLKTVARFMSSFINSNFDIDLIKNKVAAACCLDNIFTTICLWDFLVAIASKVFIGLP